MENSFKFNSLQSTIEDLNLSMYPEEIQEQFYEYISTVPYIKNLVSKDRPRAKDLPRDEEGKIEIDLTNPHIVEDTDYFRQAALNFQKFGKYTNLRPNPNPNSEFGKWFREEVRRCYYGLVRESDGEWITGDYYFFLNYCPIMKVKKIKGNVGTRVFDFPDFLEGQYLKYHYINKARNNGKHGTEMAKRGAGKSFTLAALLAKRFIFGESPESNTRTESFCASYRKDYLIDDGILNKFEAYIHFCSENTEFPSRRRVKDSLNEMQWRAGYKDLKTGTTKGTLNEVIGVSVKDSEGKLRGKRGALIGLEEIGSFPNLLGLYGTLRPSMEDGDMVFGMIFGQGCVCAGTKVAKPNGEIINIEDVNVGDKLLGYNGTHTTTEDITWKQPIGYKNCVKIKTEKANILECSDDHPILALNKDRFGHSLGTCSFYRANELKIGDTLLMPKYISRFGKVHEPNAFLLGSLFGDGSYTKGSCVTLSITTEEEYEYYNNNYNIGISKLSKGGNKYAQIYFRGLHPLLKKYDMDNQSFERKTFPNNIFDWDKASVSAFLSGYFNADGNVQIVKDKHISIKLTCKYEKPLIQTKSLLAKFGISSHIYKERKKERVLKSNTNNKEYVMPASECYVLYISNSIDIVEFRNSMKFLIKEKQLRLDSYIPTSTRGIVSNLKFTLRDNGKGIHLLGSTFDDLQCVTIKSIEDIGIRRIYNMTADTTHTYLSNGFISSNTAGDKDSDFTAAQSIMYAPKGFNMQDIPNVYDKVGTAAPDFVYFFPAYLNRNGCYNKDGVSNVTKALLEVLVNRYNVKYNNPDFTVVTKTISEHPIVPQEAVLRSRGNMFPVSSLQERLNQLKNNPNEYDDVYVGTLVLNSKGKVEFKPTSDNPIRKFPTDDNKVKGAIEIFQMPKTNKDGEVVSNRYIVGHDPVDQDTSNTMSLTSTFVFDLYTDSIVAEYTGRQEYAEENYEIVRLLCLFFNAKCLYESNKKGMFAYFSKMNSLYLLADTPEYLRDKQLIKYSSFGNNAKGVNANMAINNYANELIKDWLLKPTTITIKEDGEDKEITMPSLYRIRNMALLQELIAFNPDINVDRVRALGMVMLYREEKMILFQGNINGEKESLYLKNYLGNDPFFTNNYDNRFMQ